MSRCARSPGSPRCSASGSPTATLLLFITNCAASPVSRMTRPPSGLVTCTPRLAGSRHHGASFCGQAAAAGAVAVLTDQAGRERAIRCGLPVFVVADPRARLGEVASWVYGEPSGKLLLIGVTGTSGKTTTTYLIESGLRMAGHLTGLIGGVETRIGGHRRAEQADHSRGHRPAGGPRGHGRAAGDRGGDGGLQPRAGARPGRRDLVRGRRLHQPVAGSPGLSPRHGRATSPPRPSCSRRGTRKSAVVNVDDPHGRRSRTGPPIPVTTFSASGRPDADWRAVDVRCGADGSTFQVIGPGGVEADASITLPGPFNVANALAADRRAGRDRRRPRHGRDRRGRLSWRAWPARASRQSSTTSPCSSTTRTSQAPSRPC